MKIVVHELLVCEDGEHTVEHFRTRQGAWQYLIENYRRYIENFEDLDDDDHVIDALADSSIDVRFDSYILDTDDFNKAPDNKEVTE
jgi:hypothetical protein